MVAMTVIPPSLTNETYCCRATAMAEFGRYRTFRFGTAACRKRTQASLFRMTYDDSGHGHRL